MTERTIDILFFVLEHDLCAIRNICRRVRRIPTRQLFSSMIEGFSGSGETYHETVCVEFTFHTVWSSGRIIGGTKTSKMFPGEGMGLAKATVKTDRKAPIIWIAATISG